MPTAYILVGPSGAGKTTWQESKTPSSAWLCSADTHFTDFEGNYKFIPKYLSEAHAICLKRYVAAIEQKYSVICDNTNTTIAEISPYISLALAHHYKIRIIFFDTPADVCIERNTKNVPSATVERMEQQVAVLKASWPSYWPEWEQEVYEYE